MDEIERADPATRRLALIILGCGTIAGLAFLLVVRRLGPDLNAWIERDLSARLPLVAIAMIVVTTGPIFGLTAYLLHLGQRIVRSQRYPPPGLRIIQDAVVVSGSAARRRGRLIQGLAASLGLAAALLAYMIWRVFSMLVRAVT